MEIHWWKNFFRKKWFWFMEAEINRDLRREGLFHTIVIRSHSVFVMKFMNHLFSNLNHFWPWIVDDNSCSCSCIWIELFKCNFTVSVGKTWRYCWTNGDDLMIRSDLIR
jgi:hypothetical protein